MMTEKGNSDEEEGSSRMKVARRSYAVEWSGPITYCRYGVRWILLCESNLLFILIWISAFSVKHLQSFQCQAPVLPGYEGSINTHTHT